MQGGGGGVAGGREEHHRAGEPRPTSPLPASLQLHLSSPEPAQATFRSKAGSPASNLPLSNPASPPPPLRMPSGSYRFGSREVGQLVDTLVSISPLPSSRCSPRWQLKDLEGTLEWKLGPRSLSWPCHLPFYMALIFSSNGDNIFVLLSALGRCQQ